MTACCRSQPHRSEWFPHGDLEEAAIDYDDYPEHHVIEENEKKEELVVYNNITSREKLRICLHMSEALADLHGYKNGVIVHQDVQLSQFLLNKDFTRIKLNDFNRAEFMLWDEEAQEYCLYSSGAAHGNVSIFHCTSSKIVFIHTRKWWSHLFVLSSSVEVRGRVL